MAEPTGDVGFIGYSILLMTAAVVAVPVFRRLGLGSILGYLAAGVVVGPILRLIAEPEGILHFAELGVVLLLFVIGLELKPSRLWSMRQDIFGLGAAQVIISGIVLAALAGLVGNGFSAAVVIGFGLALSSTAIGLQTLEERNERPALHGQKAFSILLFQDLAIVPLIALVSILAPSSLSKGDESIGLLDVTTMIGAVAIVILAGRYLLNPLFRMLAVADAREIMTAAALLIVLSAATLMQWAGLSMAMGAFLAGVLLAESSFRHELEANIEPFRGLLLGLFFIAVGMALNINVIIENWYIVISVTLAMMAVKAGIIYGLLRVTRTGHNDAVRVALLLPQAGEFGFVIFTQAASVFVISQNTASLLTASITLSMALTPLSIKLCRYFLTADAEEEMVMDFEGAEGKVLMIGFSRFGHIAAQHLLAEGVDVTIIDSSPNRIRNAAKFGFKVYYGDGRRLDVLRAAGAGAAEVICICVRGRDATDQIFDLVKSSFPLAKTFVRSYDRVHTLDLVDKGVDFEIRETYESAMVFGTKTLEAVGIAPERAHEVASDIRRRDMERLAIQQVEGVYAGLDMLHGTFLQPEPLTAPKKLAEALSEETAEIADTDTEDDQPDTDTAKTDDREAV